MSSQNVYSQTRSSSSGLTFFYLETGVFSVLILASLYFIWSVPFYLTMDGPAHLYNATLISSFDTNDLLQNFFRKNSVLLPNIFSHGLLVLLNDFFEPLVSEKILLSLLAIFLPLSFRWAVSVVLQNRNGFSLLIFPFVFSDLLHHGFYNFCLAFIFLNLHFALSFRISGMSANKAVYRALFLVNSLVLILSHAFVFAVALPLGLCLMLFRPAERRAADLLWAISLLLPSLFVFVSFFLSTTIPHYEFDMNASDKWLTLISFGNGIVFDPKNELGAACLVFLLLITLSSAVLVNRRGSDFLRRSGDVFLPAALLLTYLIFHTTDGLFGGMFVKRLFYLSFYLMAWWLATQIIDLPFLRVASILFVCYSFISLAIERKKVMLAIAPEITDIIEAGELLNDGSLVKVVDNSSGWFRAHFSNYLGLKKEVVLSENYEAVLDWFPLHWKIDPQLITHERGQALSADYLFQYTNPRAPVYSDSLVQELGEQAELLFRASNGSCSLYRLHH